MGVVEEAYNQVARGWLVEEKSCWIGRRSWRKKESNVELFDFVLEPSALATVA